MQLRSGVAAAVAWASGYKSDSTPSLGTSICHGCSPKKRRKKGVSKYNSSFQSLTCLLPSFSNMHTALKAYSKELEEGIKIS